MKVTYLNHEDDLDPMNRTEITSSAHLAKLLDDRRQKPPFVAHLAADNGFKIVFGVSTDLACVEHRRSNGAPPYLMAVSPRPSMQSGYFEFLAGGTPTPIPARNIITFDEMKQIAQHFLERGERSDAFSWEAV